MKSKSNIELRKRLREAENLLRRGIACLNRVGWEKGETDDEWKMDASMWVNYQRLERNLSKKYKG